MASAAPRRAATQVAPLLDPAHQKGLVSLLSRTYGKPVELNLRPIQRPYDDAGVLAGYVAQQLRDRKSVVRKVIREVTWKAKLPSQSTIARLQQERLHRHNTAKPLSLADLTHAGTKTSRVVTELELAQVSSVRVQAAGRLSKRLTANQAETLSARHGATDKNPALYDRGVQKASVTSAQRSGKRRIGVYGITAQLGHT